MWEIQQRHHCLRKEARVVDNNTLKEASNIEHDSFENTSLNTNKYRT